MHRLLATFDGESIDAILVVVPSTVLDPRGQATLKTAFIAILPEQSADGRQGCPFLCILRVFDAESNGAILSFVRSTVVELWETQLSSS